MSIVSSTHTVGHEQADGRRYVTEEHVDSASAVHLVTYLAAVGTDYVAIRDARAIDLATQLADEEAAIIIGAN